MIWALILHHSISISTLEYEDGISVNRSFDSTKERYASAHVSRATVKAWLMILCFFFSLLQWIQNRIPRLSISNFTSDWVNGVAIGALVNAVAPGICPDWDSWNVNNPEYNVREGMLLAHQWLDVEDFIAPEELIKSQVDEKSMMVYLSQFPTAKLKSSAPLRSKRTSDR